MEVSDWTDRHNKFRTYYSAEARRRSSPLLAKRTLSEARSTHSYRAIFMSFRENQQPTYYLN